MQKKKSLTWSAGGEGARLLINQPFSCFPCLWVYSSVFLFCLVILPSAGSLSLSVFVFPSGFPCFCFLRLLVLFVFDFQPLLLCCWGFFLSFALVFVPSCFLVFLCYLSSPSFGLFRALLSSSVSCSGFRVPPFVAFSLLVFSGFFLWFFFCPLPGSVIPPLFSLFFFSRAQPFLSVHYSQFFFSLSSLFRLVLSLSCRFCSFSPVFFLWFLSSPVLWFPLSSPLSVQFLLVPSFFTRSCLTIVRHERLCFFEQKQGQKICSPLYNFPPFVPPFLPVLPLWFL